MQPETIYLVLDTTEPDYNGRLTAFEATHKGNANNAELSIATLINNKVMIKIQGVKKSYANGIPTLRLFDETQDNERWTYYYANLPEQIL